MTLHVFNPEHDLAMGANLANFTPPLAARRLRMGLGFIPALWAADGDAVLVDDVELARSNLKEVLTALSRPAPRVHFVTTADLCGMSPQSVSPWGWDRAVCHRLLRHGVRPSSCPTEGYIDAVRSLSHRRTAAMLLPALQQEGTVGMARECTSAAQISAMAEALGHVVVKAPWSSSGRGVRIMHAGEEGGSLMGWIKNMLNQQGCLMVEPYYKKVKDFGMEFFSDGRGGITYLGLSLFEAEGSAYTGNMLAAESVKSAAITACLPGGLLDSVKARIQQSLAVGIGWTYTGPFGIDMMVVEGNAGTGFLLHPCVEINLRRTMGHVALSLTPADENAVMTMRIAAGNNCKLKIQAL